MQFLKLEDVMFANLTKYERMSSIWIILIVLALSLQMAWIKAYVYSDMRNESFKLSNYVYLPLVLQYYDSINAQKWLQLKENSKWHGDLGKFQLGAVGPAVGFLPLDNP